jgi:hypothetical protein
MHDGCQGDDGLQKRNVRDDSALEPIARSLIAWSLIASRHHRCVETLLWPPTHLGFSGPRTRIACEEVKSICIHIAARDPRTAAALPYWSLSNTACPPTVDIP